MCGEFATVIANQFDDIKKKFEKKSFNNFGEFDKDLFIDAYIKCSDTLKNKQMSESEYIKYYWASYANSYKTSKSEPIYISLSSLNKSEIISTQSSYNYNIDIKYKEIIDAIYDKFDKCYVDAWLEHVLNNKSYKDLERLGYDFKFNDVFKKIVNWTRQNFKRT